MSDLVENEQQALQWAPERISDDRTFLKVHKSQNRVGSAIVRRRRPRRALLAARQRGGQQNDEF
jgi:hypothetical protein